MITQRTIIVNVAKVTINHFFEFAYLRLVTMMIPSRLVPVELRRNEDYRCQQHPSFEVYSENKNK